MSNENFETYARSAYEDIRDLIHHLRATEYGDDALTALYEHPLEVLVRSGWHAPGNPAGARTGGDFYILTSTGGPAIRVRGKMGSNGPEDAWLEVQDWGTPWTPVIKDDFKRGVLIEYASQFLPE